MILHHTDEHDDRVCVAIDRDVDGEPVGATYEWCERDGVLVELGRDERERYEELAYAEALADWEALQEYEYEYQDWN